MGYATLAPLWIVPAAALALIILQLIRSRRREVYAGSLMLWRRVAAKEKAPKKPRPVFDALFWTQLGAFALLALALCDPFFVSQREPGRRLVLLIDNSPAARAHDASGRPLWEALRKETAALLAELHGADRVILVSSAPGPARIGGDEGLTQAEALAALDKLTPALSAPETENAWTFALEHARNAGTAEDPAPLAALSFRDAPAGALLDARHLWVRVSAGDFQGNAALTAAGAVTTPGGAIEVLVQVRNFSDTPRAGTLRFESLDAKIALQQAVPLTLDAQGTSSAHLRLPTPPFPPLRATLALEGGDAWPEDDTLVLVPQTTHAPRVRLHGNASHLEKLWSTALAAQFLKLGDTGATDLEVYVEEVPAQPPENANAILLLAPSESFPPFEVPAAEALQAPFVRLKGEDELTRGMKDSESGLFFIPQARKFAAAGDLKTILEDKAGNPLAARFRLRDGRTGYVLAFVPGLGPADKKFDESQTALVALLLRLLKEATGAGDPYTCARAGDVERKTGTALPLNWTPDLQCNGILDERASRLELGRAESPKASLAGLLPTTEPTRTPLRWALALGALVLFLFEFRFARSASQKKDAASAVQSPVPLGAERA